MFYCFPIKMSVRICKFCAKKFLDTYTFFASQLIRHARCCSDHSDFLSRHRALVTRLLLQGYRVDRLSNTFGKFCGRHTDLVGQYKKSVCQMFANCTSSNDFSGFFKAELIKLAKMTGVMHDADHAYSIRSTW